MSNLYLPNLNAAIVNNGIARGDLQYIIRTGAFMLLVTFLLGVCAVLAVYNSSKVAMSVGRDLRGDVFRTVQGFSQTQLSRFGVPSLITRTTNDIQQVQMAVLMGLNIMPLPLNVHRRIIMALQQDVTCLGRLFSCAGTGSAAGFQFAEGSASFELMSESTGLIRLCGKNSVECGSSGPSSSLSMRRSAGEANAELTATALEIQKHFAFYMPLQFLVIICYSSCVGRSHR